MATGVVSSSVATSVRAGVEGSDVAGGSCGDGMYAGAPTQPPQAPTDSDIHSPNSAPKPLANTCLISALPQATVRAARRGPASLACQPAPR